MNSIYVCFNFKSISACQDDPEQFDKDYQNIYKPLTKFLYSNPNFKFSFYFNGPQILYYKKKRSEFITILKQLIERKQVEIIGGGYYDPVLPLLYSVDRNTQIDMLSTEVRQTFGKRPRGITTFGDIWDSSLVNNLQTSGIEYAVLDKYSFPEEKLKYLSLFMHDLGKSVELIPSYDEYIPKVDNSPENYIKTISKNVEKSEKKDNFFQETPNKIITVTLNELNIKELIEKNWFVNLNKFLSENTNHKIKISLIEDYRNLNEIKLPVYISSAINHNLAAWCNYLNKSKNKDDSNKTVYDFMEKYKQSEYLYHRILYVTMLVNQYKNDKMRKKSSREKLLQAQNGLGLLCGNNGPFTNTQNRQNTYKFLVEAEKILREDGKFIENISRFDYNNDGQNEYVCRMQNYFSYISLLGGAIQELEIFKKTGNYADNFSRMQEYDGVEDSYKRGLFIDHILSNDQFEKYINGEASGDGVFSKVTYKEIKFSSRHHDLQLLAEAVYKPTNQKISIRKKYIINSDGMNIQYIIKNESNKKLNVKFAVESNFADINFIPDDLLYPSVEVAEKEQVIVVDTKKSTNRLNKKGKFSNVELVRYTDKFNGISFSFEPNENCGYCYYPIIYKRPDFITNNLISSNATYVSTMFWDINIEAGMETEKNINFSITSVKKEKRN